MFNGQKPKDMSLKRGPWSQKCANCKHYEDGKCTLIDKAVQKKDWCRDYERNA